MKKVIFNIFDMEIGGVEKSLLSLLSCLQHADYEIYVNCLSHSGDLITNLETKKIKLLEENPNNASIRYTVTTLLKKKMFRFFVARVAAKLVARKWIRSKDNLYNLQYFWKYQVPFMSNVPSHYDIAISYTWPHDFVLRKIKARKKIAFVHTDFSKIIINNSIDLKLWQKFDQIVAVSLDTMKQFLTVYPTLKDKVVTIDNYIDIEDVASKGLLVHEIIEESFTKSDHLRILSIGRYTHAKGFDMAIDAIKLLVDQGVNGFKWYIIGYGGDEEYLKKKVDNMHLTDFIVFLDKKTNPYPYLSQCDIYMQPSRYEGRPVTLTEAFVFNKPCLVTSFETAKSLVTHLENAYIVDLESSKIAEGIKTMLADSDLRRKISYNLDTIQQLNKSSIDGFIKLLIHHES